MIETEKSKLQIENSKAFRCNISYHYDMKKTEKSIRAVRQVMAIAYRTDYYYKFDYAYQVNKEGNLRVVFTIQLPGKDS
ncbi:MAG: hypothetical protein MJA30_22685 [Cytophagales bacterium]|nr:hypothetical protein [Cytophagales bacterium]